MSGTAWNPNAIGSIVPPFSGGSGGGGPVPVGGPGAGYDFVFDQFAVQNPAINLYSVWADLITAINPPSLPPGAPPVVTFRNDFTIPLAGMPVTGWPMNLAKLRGVTPVTGITTLTIPDGGKLDMLEQIEHGLIVSCAPTTDGVFEWSLFPPGTVPRVLSVGLGAVLQNLTPNGSAAILSPGGGTYVVWASVLAQYGSFPPSTGPFVRTVVGDTVIGNVSAQGPATGGRLPDGWVVGPVGSFLVYQMEVDAIVPKTPGFLGALAIPLPATQATTVPRAIKGALRSLIFTDGVVNPWDTDTFTVWADLYETLLTLAVPVQILFTQTVAGVPLHLPTGTWVMGRGVTWGTTKGLANGECQVFLDDGCVIQDLYEIREGLAVVGNSTAPSMTFAAPPPGQPIIIIMHPGTALANVGASPVIAHAVADALFVGLMSTASIANAGGAAVIDVAGGSTLVVYGVGGDVQHDTISGAVGAVCVMQCETDETEVSLVQGGWLGLPLGGFVFSTQRGRVNIQTAPLPSGSVYVVLNGSEFVRCAPTGLGAITITLPDPTLEPLQTVLVKKTTADVIDAINVSAAGGSTIDGVLVYPLPATPYSMIRFVSDGVNWWATS